MLPVDDALLDDLMDSENDMLVDEKSNKNGLDTASDTEDEGEVVEGASLSSHLRRTLLDARRMLTLERETLKAASTLLGGTSKRRRSISPERRRTTTKPSSSSKRGKSGSSTLILSVPRSGSKSSSTLATATSATATSSKNKRNYKVLPTDDSGLPPLPLVLGRSNNRTTVLELGEVVSQEGFSRGKYFYPVGFKCKRRYYSYTTSEEVARDRPIKSLNKKTFICTVERENSSPKPSEQDGQHQEPILLLQDTEIDRLWENLQALYCPTIRERLSEDFHLPESFLGLDHDSLQKYYAEQSSKQ